MEILKIGLKLDINITCNRWDTVLNIFSPKLDLLLKFCEIDQKCSNSLNFWARKMVFFINGSEFRQKLIGAIIRVLVRHLRA